MSHWFVRYHRNEHTQGRGDLGMKSSDFDPFVQDVQGLLAKHRSYIGHTNCPVKSFAPYLLCLRKTSAKQAHHLGCESQCAARK